MNAQSNELTLLIADADQTQAYVFESSKLPEIRGASGQLDRLNERIGKLVEQVEGADCVYADGGMLLALVPGYKAAADLAGEIEALYARETKAATITADWRPLPEAYSDERFSDYVSWGHRWLKRRKESKGMPPFYETLPHQARCRSCQKRPAVADYAGRMPDWPICDVCFQKREDKSAWLDRFEEKLADKQEWRDDYYKDHSGKERYSPQTVSEIAQASQARAGYVAFLYLDGDRIGQLLQEIRGRDAYGAVSQALREVTEDAVYGALSRHLQPASVKGDAMREEIGQSKLVGKDILIHPFEIITIGGDDVLLIVPAHAAIPIAADIGRVFGEQMTAAVERITGMARRVTMSAGVVVADDHTPVHVLRDLAEQLLKEAKKQGGAVDFHVLKSADMLDRKVDAVREAYPYRLEKVGKGGKPVSLLGRPYSHDEALTLWQELKALKRVSFASSQMAMLGESLLDGRQASTLFFHYQKERPTHREAYLHLQELLEKLHSASARDPLPWQETPGEEVSHRTALWDVAELYDFVPSENREGVDD